MFFIKIDEIASIKTPDVSRRHTVSFSDNCLLFSVFSEKLTKKPDYYNIVYT